VQIERVRSRDEASRDEAIARIAAQKPLAEKVSVADFVIDTDGPIERSRERTDEVLRAICEKLGVDPARYAIRDNVGPR
jgi:dephospho-CoA kinase